VLAQKTRLLEVPEAVEDEVEERIFPDERLELIFTCCHPSLALEAQVALTLRALGGLSTEEIARAFLVSEETMKRRLSRAKHKIRDAGIPFRLPAEHLLPERLAAVLAVVYLIFNEGYGGRIDLAAEALRLGAALTELMPDEPEVRALMALMLLDDARRDARFADGELVLLADQDSSLWDAAKITRGREALECALALQGRGAYVIQAAIASLHMEEPRDWPQIAALYGELVRLTGSAVVELNRAIAIAEVDGAEPGLALVDRLDLDDYQYFHSTRADLLRRLGRAEEARMEYERALALAHTEPERRFLERRAAEVSAYSPPLVTGTVPFRAVAGATGRVGRHVVDVLETDGHDVVAISRSRGVDLVTGEGLAEALAGVATIIDVAAQPTPDEEAATAFFTASARNLQEAGAQAGVERIVVVSIIGIDRFTTGYFAAKLAQERAMLSGPIPVRILRAAQFHEFVPELVEWGRQGELSYVPSWRTQLVAARTVAEALVNLANGSGPARESSEPPFPEIAGPREENLVEVAKLLVARRDDPVRVERASDPTFPESYLYEAGALLPGPQATLAGPTFEEWLDSTSLRRN
jgi:RNA polymerase sigma-70 factor (ECF subfamily)